MNAGSRQQYLEALGIDVWVLKGRAASNQPAASEPAPDDATPDPVSGPVRVAPGLPLSEAAVRPGASRLGVCIGPGDSSVLLLCARPEDAATQLAADIARSLDAAPVWGWCIPLQDERSSLDAVISERLFTRILSFGVDPGTVGAGLVGGAVGIAQWLQADPLAELLQSAAARRALWASLAARNWHRVQPAGHGPGELTAPAATSTSG